MFCVLSELAAAQLHSMHASFTVLSTLSCVIVCYSVFCVLSGLAAVRLLHTMPGFLLCYQCYYNTVHEYNIDNTVKETWNVTVCFVCYQGWQQQHSDIVLSMLFCVVCYQGWQQHSFFPCL